MREATIKDIATRIKWQKENNHHNTAIFIGAGCSVSAGIPAGKGMMEEMDNKYSLLLSDCLDKTYAGYMKKLSRSDRKEFLGSYIEKAKLNMSHLFLASLVRNGYVDCIITTNFDNLALKALTTLNVFPAVYDLASSSKYINGMLSFPSVLYLHGQHTGWKQMNTDAELKAAKPSIESALREVCATRTLIVIGYSGNDPVLDVLGDIPSYNNFAYWITRSANGMSPQVKEKLFDDPLKDFLHVPGYDSDKFFYTLHNELSIDAPDLFSHPFHHLVETYDLISRDLKLDDKPFDMTSNAREKIARAEKLLITEITSGKKITTKDIIALSLDSWMGWKKNNPDDLFDEVKTSNNIVAKQNLSNAYIERGGHFFIAKDYKNALLDFDKIVELDKNNAWGHHNKALVFANTGRESLALEDYNLAIKLQPKNAAFYYNRGNAYLSLKNYKLAMADYNKALELKPAYAQAYNNRGNIYEDVGQLELAMADYTRGIETNTTDSIIYGNRAKLFVKKRMFKEAELDYNKSIELNPADSTGYSNRAILFSEQGKIDLAFKDYNTALSLDEKNYTAYNNRGNLYRKIGDLPKALSDVEKAIELNSEGGYAYSTLAEIYAIKKDEENFYKYIELALQKMCPIWELTNDVAYSTFKEQPRFIRLLEKYQPVDVPTL